MKHSAGTSKCSFNALSTSVSVVMVTRGRDRRHRVQRFAQGHTRNQIRQLRRDAVTNFGRKPDLGAGFVGGHIQMPPGVGAA